MKRFSFIIAIFTVMLLSITACKKDSSNYYIKYEVDVESVYSGEFTHITLNTDRGEQSIQTGKTFSETYGPVDKSFVSKIQVYTTAYQADVNVRIYACKGDEQFVLGASKTASDPTEQYPLLLVYRIDF